MRRRDMIQREEEGHRSHVPQSLPAKIAQTFPHLFPVENKMDRDAVRGSRSMAITKSYIRKRLS